MKRSRTWLLLLLVLVACNEPVPEKTPRKQALESVTRDIFIPMLTQLELGAGVLDDAAQELCAPPAAERSMVRLDETRAAWSRACERWKLSDVMSFGPHLMAPHMFASDIDFWPVREGSIDALLGAAMGAGDEDGGVAEAGKALPELPETLTASQKGLPAIEYLLFGPRDQTLAAFRDGARGDQRCAYLQRMTDTLAHDTSELRRVFAEEFAPDFTLEHNPNERYDSVNEAFGELVNNMVFAVETVRGTRLAKPLGLTAGGVPQPELVESRYSEQSIRAAVAVLEGVRLVFLGEAPGDDSPPTHIYGIHSVLQSRGLDFSSEYTSLHLAAVAALEAIPAPLSQAVVDDAAKVQLARDAITDLLMLLQVDVAQALSVTATFGRNDGDGD
jgi:predicted lipoprotein